MPRLTFVASAESRDCYVCGIGIEQGSSILRVGTMLLDKGPHTQAVLQELKRQEWSIEWPAYLNQTKPKSAPVKNQPVPKPVKKKFIVKPTKKR